MFLTLDPLYWMMMIPVIILMMGAQFWVKSAFNKYSEVMTSSGLRGVEVARRILRHHNITDVEVEETEGMLSDHYDPTNKVLRLSPEVYEGRSAASVGVAAHEVGHALQHAKGYAPLVLRTALYPLVSIGSMLWLPLLIIGMLMASFQLAVTGVIAFGTVVLFQLVTLPVEFDASRRAMAEVQALGIVSGSEEIKGARRVLTAAAMTYVAALIQSVVTLLYFLIKLGLLGGDE